MESTELDVGADRNASSECLQRRSFITMEVSGFPTDLLRCRDPSRASLQGNGWHRARAAASSARPHRGPRPPGTPATASPRRARTRRRWHQGRVGQLNAGADIRRQLCHRRIVRAHSRAARAQPLTQLDGARPPERAGARLVGEPPDRHRPARQLAEQLRKTTLRPLAVGVVARLDRREHVSLDTMRLAELREKHDVARERPAGEGAPGDR